MSGFEVVLRIHVVAGTAALVAGAIAMFSRKRRGLHMKAGSAYHWLVAMVCVSAVAMATLDWDRLWWFLPISMGSYAFALTGYRAAKRRSDRNWVTRHVSGFGGSYIAMVTALLVVNWRFITGVPGVISPLAWSLPTLLGSPVIAWVNHRIRKADARRLEPVTAVDGNR